MKLLVKEHCDGFVVKNKMFLPLEMSQKYDLGVREGGGRYLTRSGAFFFNKKGLKKALDEFIQDFEVVGCDDRSKKLIRLAHKRAKKEAAKADLSELIHYLDGKGKHLRPYQEEGVQFLLANQKALLADDTGLGKTVVILSALKYIEITSKVSPAVLVACSNIAMLTWLDEIEEWTDFEVYRIKAKKDFRLPKNGEVVLCTWGMLPDSSKSPRIKTKNFCLIGDEIQALKNPEAIRSKSWDRIKLSVEAKKGIVWGASATPLENKPKDFWEILGKCGIDKEVFGHFYRFKKLYGAYSGPHGLVWPEDGVDPRVPRIIKKKVLHRKKRDVLKELPKVMPPRYIKVRINQSSEVMRQLQEIEDYIAEHKLTIEKFIELVLRKKIDFIDMTAVRKLCAAAKIPTMLDYCRGMEESNEPVIIICCYKEPILQLKEKLGWEVITGEVSVSKRRKIVKAFQSGDLPALGCTLRAANESVTLTRANRMAFVDQDWNTGKNTQARGRIDRFGQTRNLYYDYFTIKNSIDEKVAEVLARKQSWNKLTFG